MTFVDYGFPHNLISIYEIEYGILFGHLNYQFPSFPFYDWKSYIFHIQMIESSGFENSVRIKRSPSGHFYFTQTCLRKSKYFELFVDTNKVRDNLWINFNIRPWRYNSSESNHCRKNFCLVVACSSPFIKLLLLG